MSTIAATISHGIYFGSTRNGAASYSSPLTITNTGAVLTGTAQDSAAVYDAAIGALTNHGTIIGGGYGTADDLGVKLAGGSITNTGMITGVFSGVLLEGQGLVTNSGTILSTYDTSDRIGFRSDVAFDGGGTLINSVGGDITGGVGFLNAAGTAFNAGSITNDDGIGIDLQFGGTVTDSGSVSGSSANPAIYFGGVFYQKYFGAGPTASLLDLEAGYSISGTVVGNDIAGSTNAVELTGSAAAPVTVDFSPTNFTNFGTVAFAPGNPNYGTLALAAAADIPGTISGLTGLHDVVDLSYISDAGNDATVTLNGSDQLIVTGDNGMTTLQLDPDDSYNGISFAAVPDASGTGTDVTVEEEPCFCRGTRILTPRGEIMVEQLAVGDTVLTLSGEVRPLTWIGSGRSLVTAANPGARPIVVRRGALEDGVPARDLYLTKGHSLLIDGVLIPVEFLINDRSITWDTTARGVEFYHLELERHDVLLADGAAAESYRDDGNRHLFHNADLPRHASEDMPHYAPVLTGGPEVDRAWARLLARAGGGETALTDDADLHLLADGVRVEGTADGMHYRFRLDRTPFELRIRSRICNPTRLGTARDPRDLGVAVRCIRLRGDGAELVMHYDSPWLTDGYNGAEPLEAVRWTTGDGVVPSRVLAAFDGGPVELELQLGMATRYPRPAGVVAPEEATAQMRSMTGG